MTSLLRTEVEDVVRAACGGMLFGIPLLYTMEVWWVGSMSSPPLLLGVLATSFGALVVLNRTGGFRSSRGVTLGDTLKDSVEGLAIALVCVFAILVLIREATLSTPAREVLGKVLYEATPFTLGVGLARHFLHGDRTGGKDDASEDDDGGEAADDRTHVNPTLADIGATVLGAVFVAFNVAPTDEVPMIASAMSPVWVVTMVLVSLVVSYGIVFAAGFGSQSARHEQRGLIQHPVTETLVCYLVGLVASLAMLWFFQRWEPGDPFDMVLEHVIVLGLPAAVGGAAGRLVV